jgi:thiol-disulfide isomerase/thioredoxin
MKTIVLGCALLCSIAVASAQKLPQVDEAGYTKLVAAHKGKVVLVEFWATWCVPCRQEMPELVKLEQRLRPRGLDVLMISADAPEQAAEAAKVFKESGMAAPGFMRNVADEDAFCHSLDPSWEGALPAIFIYDKAGKKVKSFIGATPTKTIEAAVDKLLPARSTVPSAY